VSGSAGGDWASLLFSSRAGVRLGRVRACIQDERSTEPGQHHLAGVSSSGVDRERIGKREWLAVLDDELDALTDQPG
jgi:hypothetical protein